MNKIFLTHFFQKHVAIRVVFYVHDPCFTQKFQVCKICKDMVGQARDTLLSNETQEELKEVFDGSCDLIPIKIIAKECKAISDEFIPELVETLASEMNPDQVCTVSGKNEH